jgi:cytochrome c oxidase cbb3-type subunit 2
MVEGGAQVKRLAAKAALLIASVYGFFLIFAQFAFIEQIRAAGAGSGAEKALLGVMALAGIAAGFLTAWRGASTRSLRIAMGAAALAAALAPMASRMPGAFAVACMTGAALGTATVCLSALLPAWCGLFHVGLGTGLGYALCNVPAVFQQTPAIQSWIGAGFAFIGMLVVPGSVEWRVEKPTSVFLFWAAVALFTALVWMDSAAFFIIQHAVDLKSGTWGGDMLWRNAVVHLVLACVAGAWLHQAGARALPGIAWVLLAVAALAVNVESTRWIAGWFYPAGVSLYSAALVAWPGWFSGAEGPRQAAWRGAWLFAIAGWFGSANGIGMAQSLQQVPPIFIVAAGVVVLGVELLSKLGHWRVALAVAGVAAVSMAHEEKKNLPSSALERGHQVYLSEGCINCHSQYVRPGSHDVEPWGPPSDARTVMKGAPVMIGNRRQGPDLSNVGARRSETWLKLHFVDPRALSPDSPMPSYSHLFEDGRGDDLVRYLKDSGVGATSDMMARSAVWKPAESTGKRDAKTLYQTHCTACHGTLGGGNGPLAWHFTRRPANLMDGPFIWTAEGGDRNLSIARAIKFGIPGTDMPGHETLDDADITSLAEYVAGLRRKH